MLVVTGGIDLRGFGIRFSSRDPFRPACVAAFLIAVYTAAFTSSASVYLLTLRSAVARGAQTANPALIYGRHLSLHMALRLTLALATASPTRERSRNRLGQRA